MSKFAWPGYPSNRSEFVDLMLAVDAELDRRGLEPQARPLHVAHLLWEALGWGGSVLSSEALVHSPSFEGDALMAKANDWYSSVYGSRLNSGASLGQFPARIGRAEWRVTVPIVYGQVRLFIDPSLSNGGRSFAASRTEANYNILRAVESLTEHQARLLTIGEMEAFFHRFVLAYQALMWHSELPRDALFSIAEGDFAMSTEAFLKGRFVQSRWDSLGALEKTFKGLLKLGGTAYATSGAKGHDLQYLASLLKAEHGINLPTTQFALVVCPAAVRYAEIPTTKDDAFRANEAVLDVFDTLRKIVDISALCAAKTQ